MVGFDDDFPQPAAKRRVPGPHVAARARSRSAASAPVPGRSGVGDRAETFALEASRRDRRGHAGPAVVGRRAVELDGRERRRRGHGRAADRRRTRATRSPGSACSAWSSARWPDRSAEVLADARAAAAAADVAVVVVGLTEEQETEAVDKSTIALPGDQDALVRAVAEAAAQDRRRGQRRHPGADAVGRPGRRHRLGRSARPGGRARRGRRAARRDRAGRSAGHHLPGRRRRGAGLGGRAHRRGAPLRRGHRIGYRGHFAGHGSRPRRSGSGTGWATRTWEYADADAGRSGEYESDRPRHRDQHRRRGTAARSCRSTTGPPRPTSPSGWSAGPRSTSAAGESASVEVATDARLWRRWDAAADGWGAPLTGGELLIARGLGDIRAELTL